MNTIFLGIGDRASWTIPEPSSRMMNRSESESPPGWRQVRCHGRQRQLGFVGAWRVGELDRDGFCSTFRYCAVQLLDRHFCLVALVKTDETDPLWKTWNHKKATLARVFKMWSFDSVKMPRNAFRKISLLHIDCTGIQLALEFLQPLWRMFMSDELFQCPLSQRTEQMSLHDILISSCRHTASWLFLQNTRIYNKLTPISKGKIHEFTFFHYLPTYFRTKTYQTFIFDLDSLNKHVLNFGFNYRCIQSIWHTNIIHCFMVITQIFSKRWNIMKLLFSMGK